MENWDLVKRPIDDGGLQIIDLSLTNLSLGYKLLWKLYVDLSHPVNEMLRAKYAHDILLRLLSSGISAPDMQTWNLCRKSLDLFKINLYRILGNGKKILLWEDRIMDCAPLNSHDEISELRYWLINTGKRRLLDISVWDNKGNWLARNFPIVPEHLRTQLSMLKLLLTDVVPIHKDSVEIWGWGHSGNYTTASGYISLQPKKDKIRSPKFWKQV